MRPVTASRGMIAAWVSAVALAMPTVAAFAQSHQALTDRCMGIVNPRAMVTACMGGQRGPPSDACMGKARAAVRACYLTESQKIVKAAPAAPKDDADIAAKDSGPVATTFVAPPRTITDIAAILDNEKPDPEKIAERKQEADAAAPTSGSRADIAEFYFDRANARALLARNREALADGLKALELMPDVSHSR